MNTRTKLYIKFILIWGANLIIIAVILQMLYSGFERATGYIERAPDGHQYYYKWDNPPIHLENCDHKSHQVDPLKEQTAWTDSKKYYEITQVYYRTGSWMRATIEILIS